MKQMVFDTTDAATIADSDSVGAFLRASDGTLLTHTDVGGKKALDVRVAEGINVEVDLDHADDSVRLGDGTTLTTVTTNGGKNGLDVNLINNDITVVATDLDIRDLTAVSDSVASHTHDGAGTAITSTDEGGGVQAMDVHIANTIATSDAALANTAIAAASNDLDVANTAEDAVAAPLANRKYLFIHNNGNREIHIGQSGVTSANGYPLSPQMAIELRAGAAIDIEWVGPNTSQQIRTLELS